MNTLHVNFSEHTEPYFHYTKAQWRSWARAWRNSLKQGRRGVFHKQASAMNPFLEPILTIAQACLLQQTRLLVASYVPLPQEPDVWPAIEALNQQHPNIDICLPRIVSEGLLSWHYWQGQPVQGSHTDWEQVQWELWQPQATTPMVQNRIPDVLIAPALMADERGYRLGYGAGYYDRQLHYWSQQGKLPSCRILLSFQECTIRQLPTAEHDVPFTHVVTETQVYSVPSEFAISLGSPTIYC
jgi:5-formyltetrahydrofolate cyclo-ligase